MESVWEAACGGVREGLTTGQPWKVLSDLVRFAF